MRLDESSNRAGVPMTSEAERRRRGRPATEKGKPVMLRLSPDLQLRLVLQRHLVQNHLLAFRLAAAHPQQSAGSASRIKGAGQSKNRSVAVVLDGHARRRALAPATLARQLVKEGLDHLDVQDLTISTAQASTALLAT